MKDMPAVLTLAAATLLAGELFADAQPPARPVPRPPLVAPVARAGTKVETTVRPGGPADVAVTARYYLADPELVKLVLSATTDSGETDTAKWMTLGR